jgi:hypothetical protein
MPPLITATTRVHSVDENQVGAKNGGGGGGAGGDESRWGAEREGCGPVGSTDPARRAPGQPQ